MAVPKKKAPKKAAKKVATKGTKRSVKTSGTKPIDPYDLGPGQRAKTNV